MKQTFIITSIAMKNMVCLLHTKKIIQSRIAVLILLLSMALNTHAIPAYPFPIEKKQPNGETITIRLHGDEFFHYTTTTDGYVIIQDNDGYYKYAVFNDQNILVAGKTIVTNSPLKSSGSDLIQANSTEFDQKVRQPALAQVLERKLNDAPAGKTDYSSGLRSSNAINGTVKGLIILANFKDKKFTVNQSQQAFTNMLNQSGYSENGATGSARDFFIENSNNTFTPQFEVFGPVDLPQNMEFYGKNKTSAGGSDQHPEQMIIDACNAANQKYPELNFANYDNNQDGIIDNVFVFYAGYNEAEGGGANTIWPHKYGVYNRVNPVIIDGDTLANYACTSELKMIDGVSKGMAGVGTFVHEFSHTLGLPDLYDADGAANGYGAGIGNWSTMSYGSLLNEGRTPPYFGAMERWMLGWIRRSDLNPTQNPQSAKLRPISSSNEAYFLESPTPDEFFTFEVRKKIGWDAYLPGEGMVVYHIDNTKDNKLQIEYNGGPQTVSALYLWWIGYTNIIANHPCMDLLRAGGALNSAGSPYPGTGNVRTLSDDTSPNLLSWSDERSNAKLSNIIQNADGSVSFTHSSSGGSSIDTNPVDRPFVYQQNKQICLGNIKDKTIVEIYSISGIKIISETISDNQCFDFSAGQYIVKMNVGSQVFASKIIVE